MKLRAHGKHRKGAHRKYATGGVVRGGLVRVVLTPDDGYVIPARLAQQLTDGNAAMLTRLGVTLPERDPRCTCPPGHGR